MPRAFEYPVDQLGHEAAVDLGVTALESGLPYAAVGYLEHAAELRPTRYVLVQLAKAHREAGQLPAARDRLNQANALPDGEDRFVLVSLAAVLCDLGEYDRALEVVQQAIALDPQNPAAQQVAARVMRELAGVLERSKHLDGSALGAIREQADDLARRAADANPDRNEDLLRRRRERSLQARLSPFDGVPVLVPVDQKLATVGRSGDQPASAEPPAMTDAGPAPEGHVDSPQRASRSWLWRAWDRLVGRS